MDVRRKNISSLSIVFIGDHRASDVLDESPGLLDPTCAGPLKIE